MNRREVPDFDAWLQCFSMYAAVICSKYPGKAKDLWAYQAFMVTEYRKCGGRGWLIYDSSCRRLRRPSSGGSTRAYTQQRSWPTGAARGSFAIGAAALTTARRSVHCTPTEVSRWCRCTVGQYRRTAALAPWIRIEELKRRRGRRGVCHGYNAPTGCQNGPTCRFEHACSICGGDHRRSACRVKRTDPPTNRT